MPAGQGRAGRAGASSTRQRRADACWMQARRGGSAGNVAAHLHLLHVCSNGGSGCGAQLKQVPDHLAHLRRPSGRDSGDAARRAAGQAGTCAQTCQGAAQHLGPRRQRCGSDAGPRAGAGLPPQQAGLQLARPAGGNPARQAVAPKAMASKGRRAPEPRPPPPRGHLRAARLVQQHACHKELPGVLKQLLLCTRGPGHACRRPRASKQAIVVRGRASIGPQGALRRAGAAPQRTCSVGCCTLASAAQRSVPLRPHRAGQRARPGAPTSTAGGLAPLLSLLLLQRLHALRGP